jgi:hypothetical protein
MISDEIIGGGIRGCNSMFSNTTGDVVPKPEEKGMKFASIGGGLGIKNRA